jgi:hypothetical protein
MTGVPNPETTVSLEHHAAAFWYPQQGPVHHVLLVLADAAATDGRVAVAPTWLSEETHLDVWQVNDALDELERDGTIIAEPSTSPFRAYLLNITASL